MISRSATARRSVLWRVVTVAGVGALAAFGVFGGAAAQTVKPAPGGSLLTGHVWVKPRAIGGLDCNGMSPVQKTVNTKVCTDIRGMYGIDNKFTWGGRFYDNGRYIGHDEPAPTQLRRRPSRRPATTGRTTSS